MKAWLTKFMANLCLQVAGWLCKRQHLKIVYSGDSVNELHVVLDASTGKVTSSVQNSTTGPLEERKDTNVK